MENAHPQELVLRVLEDHAHLMGLRSRSSNRLSQGRYRPVQVLAYLHLSEACCIRDNSQQRTTERSFPGTAWPSNAKTFSFFDLQRNATQCPRTGLLGKGRVTPP